MLNDKNQKFDLEERTALFGESVINFCKVVKENTLTKPIISQLIRSSTSIGANYCEADCAESRKDFIHKIGICKKESKETKHWLRMISHALPELEMEKQSKDLLKESVELNLIFSAIINRTKENTTI